MSAPAFTPGPWDYESDEGDWFITYACGRVLGKVFDHVGEFQEADARLIATAPELYEALETARDMLLERAHGNPARSAAHNARVVIETALAKARGGAMTAIADTRPKDGDALAAPLASGGGAKQSPITPCNQTTP